MASLSPGGTINTSEFRRLTRLDFTLFIDRLPDTDWESDGYVIELFAPSLPPLPDAAGAAGISIALLASPQRSRSAATRRECQTGSRVDFSFTGSEQRYLLPLFQVRVGWHNKRPLMCVTVALVPLFEAKWFPGVVSTQRRQQPQNRRSRSERGQSVFFLFLKKSNEMWCSLDVQPQLNLSGFVVYTPKETRDSSHADIWHTLCRPVALISFMPKSEIFSSSMPPPPAAAASI